MSLFFNKIALIQEVRAIHAIIESGCDVIFSEKIKSYLEPLHQYFGLDLKTDICITQSSSPLCVNHVKPSISIGGVTKSLIFPQQICEHLKCKWKSNRKNNISFVGLVTPKRQLVLNNFSNVIVIKSNKGRTFPCKSWDNQYYEYLLDSDYTLCLDGDFVWTYRFFEACLCGSIPIIENYCDLYDGFEFLELRDINNNISWNKDIANKNYNLALKRITLTCEEQLIIRGL